MRDFYRLYSKRERFAVLAGLLTIAIATGYFSLLGQYRISADQDKAETSTHLDYIYNGVANISEVTASLRTLYRVSTDFASDELEQFTSDLVDTSEFIRTIGRFDRIRRDEIESYSDLMSERGIYSFKLKALGTDGAIALAGPREYHNAVVSINPFSPSSARLIGVDLTHDQELASRIGISVRSNEPTLIRYPEGWPQAGDTLLIQPTYAGRYTPDSEQSRISQTDGGYFLELSLEGFLTQSHNLSSEMHYGERMLASEPTDLTGARFFKKLFPGTRVRITPAIGGSELAITISSIDGVTSAALTKALLWMMAALWFCVFVLLFITGARNSEYRRKSAQRALESERKIALTTLEAINDSVITMTADGEISYVNPAGEAMVGKSASELLGADISTIPFSESASNQAGLKEIESKLSEGTPTTLNELDLQASNCNSIQVDCAFSPFSEEQTTTGGVLVMRDVGQERALTRKLEHLATHDSMTGLMNRYFFELKLEELVDGAKNRGEQHGVCYVDLDQFKIVNDTCGHNAGDKLLIQLANHLKENCRPNDVLARLGGDEFGILIKDSDETECESIARRIHDTFQSFYFISGEHKFAIRACIGFVMLDQNYENVSDVLAAADIACYSAKDKGRNELHIFRAECEETSLRQGEMLMLPKLQNALAVDKFVLFVQPIAEILKDEYNSTRKYEILLRMQDEDGSLITPYRLISAAERYDLMKEIDRWVINRALQEVAALEKIYGDELPMFSINLSGQSVMDNDLIGYILGKFNQTKVAPGRICFEITETSAMGDMTRAVTLLEFLHDLGCKVALDDFGAGQCSFAYLKNLPVDYLKVDGQFVKDVDTCDVHKEMLYFVQRVASILNMQTVAEFVENESIMQCLREMEIHYAQGYHISKPFHIDELKNGAELRQVA